MECAQLVRHGVAHAQKCIGKRHSRHGRCIRHLLPCKGCVRPVVIALRQILENVLQRLECQTVGIVGCHYRCICLQCVGHSIDTGRRGQPTGLGHHQIGVDDRHVRQQLVVRQRILGAGCLISDYRKRRYLRASTRRGGNGDKVRLAAHFRELVGALANVEEAHCHVGKVCLRMLIQHPHDLRSIHSRTAAQRNDDIRFELPHQCCASLCAGQGGIRLDIREDLECHTHLLKPVCDAGGHPALEQELVGYEERTLPVQHLLNLPKCHRQAAFLKVYFLRCAEPQHVFSPLCNGLDIEQVLDTDIFRNGISAPGAAAQCEGRCQIEVIQVTDTAVRGGCIDYDTASFHLCRKSIDFLPMLSGIHVERSCMSITAVPDELVGIRHCLFKVFRTIHCQNRRELLMGKFLVQRNRGHLTDEHTGFLRNGHASKLCDLCRTLSNDLAVERTIDEDGFPHLFRFFRCEEIAATPEKFRTHGIIDGVVHDDRLLRSADHTVVERLGVDDGVYCNLNICRSINDCRCISGANAQRRLSAGVRCTHHTRTAGCQNDIRLLHQSVGHLQRGNIDPADDVLRCACLYRGLQHDLCRSNGALLCTGVRRDQDGISGFETDQRLKDRRRSGVGRWNNSSHNADGFCNAHGAVSGVLFNHAAGLGVLISVVDILGRIVILDNLILHNAHAGFLHCHFGKRQSGMVCRKGSRTKDPIHLFLRVGRKDLLCTAHLGELLHQCRDTIHQRMIHFSLTRHDLFLLF